MQPRLGQLRVAHDRFGRSHARSPDYPEEGDAVAETTRQLVVGMLMAVMSVAAERVQAADRQEAVDRDLTGVSTSPRVRTDNPVIAALIEEATDRSITFRRLVGAIQATNGVVYVEQGRCGHGRRACLPFSMIVAGPHRILRVVLERLEPGREVIGTIAHELRHALEVLEEPGITSGDLMYFFYKSHGSRRGDAFETPAAENAGNAVRQELRQRRPTQLK
jgi:hypothetical protein